MEMYNIIKELVFLNFIIAFSSFEGIRDGYMYHFYNIRNNATKYELHPFLLSFRFVVCLTVSFILDSNWNAIGDICVCMLVFSFFHNGYYYKTRNELDSSAYKLKFKDQSTTSTSYFNFSFRSRSSQLILGLLLFLIKFIVILKF